MPAAKSQPASKPKAPTFKTPRQVPSSTATKQVTAPRRKSISKKSRRPSFIDEEHSGATDEEEQDDDNDMLSEDATPIEVDDDGSLTSKTLPFNPHQTSTQDPPPTIPPALLTKLLHHHFKDDKTRLGKEANGLVGKYMETFVREAIARAAFERAEAERQETSGGGGGGWSGGFLEVDDLEKLAPQLLLDF